MIAKQTLVDQVEVTRDAHVFVRLSKQLVEGGKVISEQIHRMAIPCGESCTGAFVAANAALVAGGDAAIADEEFARVEAIAAAVFTPEAVAAWRAKQAAEAAAQSAQILALAQSPAVQP